MSNEDKTIEALKKRLGGGAKNHISLEYKDVVVEIKMMTSTSFLIQEHRDEVMTEYGLVKEDVIIICKTLEQRKAYIVNKLFEY